MIEAIVTDIHVSSAVAGMRDLGRAGVAVLGVGHGRLAAGLWSRHAHGGVQVPRPETDPRAFVDAVERLAGDRGPLIVYPGCEASLEAFLRAPDSRSNVTLPYPAALCVEAVRDKRELPRLAARAGLRAPVTLGETTVGELLDGDLRPPYVVKPIAPRPAFNSAVFIDGPEDLLALAALAAPGEGVHAQEYVAGPQLSVAVVIDRDGRVVERFAHRVVRMSPPRGGATTLAFSVPPDEDLVARVGDMLAGAGYWGLAQLDIVLGAAGPPCVFDVNPRYYLSLPLASACGVNLPAAWHRVAGGAAAAAPRPGSYRVGVTYRWWAVDVHLKRGRLWPVRGRRAGALWDTRDPVASVLLSGQAVERRLSALGRRLRGQSHLPRSRSWPAGR